MFIDEVHLIVEGGKGGAGAVAFFANKKGPCGGHGGDGGSVYATCNPQLADLHTYAGVKLHKADNGTQGFSNMQQGKNGSDLILRFPKGTLLTDTDTGVEFEIIDENIQTLLVHGGKGGKGNVAFATSTNRTPRQAEEGSSAEKRHLHVVLKLIADYGFIGLPNAGKSTLLNVLTNANVKTAMYAFTTLEPNLGVSGMKVLADIPGLIEGASKGKGLGVRFLKHVEKVPILLHCISADSTSVEVEYQTVMKELHEYNPLLTQKPQIILLTKTDLVGEDVIEKNLKMLSKYNSHVLPLSTYDEESIVKLKNILQKRR